MSRSTTGITDMSKKNLAVKGTPKDVACAVEGKKSKPRMGKY